MVLNSGRSKLVSLAVIFAISGLLVTLAMAQSNSEGNSNADLPATSEAAEFNATDNAWMLFCSALVLFMTAPGLAMFYSGLVRRKNVVSVMMQCLFLMCMMTLIWALWGYSFAFGGSNPYFGNSEYLFMNNVAIDEGGMPLTESGLPQMTFMIFQGMFFIITPALICGAFAERMKFSAMVIFSAVWGTLVYCPLCHWVWDGGILAFGESHAIAGGALDFAGGTVVHISSGISALVCAMFIGKRIGIGTSDLRPHNLTYTAIGAAMLWFGWFGFNAGSELASDGVAASAFVVTHFAAAAGGFAWAAIEWLQRGKPSVLGTASGAVAGLVCITPAAGFVNMMPAIAMGLSGGAICYVTCGVVKRKLGYDDSLDGFGIHGVGGIVGALFTGVFASELISGKDQANGIFYSFDANGLSLLLGQIAAIVVTIVFSIVMTFIILKAIDLSIGLRISADQEECGLDQTDHGEEGYIF